MAEHGTLYRKGVGCTARGEQSGRRRYNGSTKMEWCEKELGPIENIHPRLISRFSVHGERYTYNVLFSRPRSYAVNTH
jgi:hypothetical protein